MKLARSSTGRGCCPFKAEDGVRLPDELLNIGVKGNGDLRASEARDSGFDSHHPDLRPGVVTEACRSDTAAVVVRLHLGPLRQGRNRAGDKNEDFAMITRRLKRRTRIGSGVVV